MENKENGKFLNFLYKTCIGRIFLKAFASRTVSNIAGTFLSSSLSKPLIKGFVRKNHIDLSKFYSDDFKCFNDCFSRKIKETEREIDIIPSHLISPCDAYLTVYNINSKTVFPVKQAEYDIESFLNDKALAEEFKDGMCFVFRLCVNHYHRYCFIDSGNLNKRKYIKGLLHTVRPIALKNGPVFCENCREISVLDTNNFGKVIQAEVGAMLVGKIKNYDIDTFSRGQEKGMFLFGGSTIILLAKKDTVKANDEIIKNSSLGIETEVKYGQKIGIKF